MSMNIGEQSSAVRISNLNFRYERSQALHDISLELPRGCRVALLGANGAGKSTLLRIVAGNHMVMNGTVETLGQPAFRTDRNVSFLGTTWSRTVAFAGTNVSFQADIAVEEMSVELQAAYPERREMLYELLEVDKKWRMHELSDGQRRRVQLLLGLIRPFDLLVLDEITVDLDVVTRQDFMGFLKRECDERGATIVYATHIFDGLDEWATHLAYLSYGKLVRFGTLSSFTDIQQARDAGVSTPLLHTIAKWLRADRATRKAQLEAARAAENDAQKGALAAAAEATPAKYLSNGWGAGRMNSSYK